MAILTTEAAVRLHDHAVIGKAPCRHRLLHLREIEARPRHGDAGANVDAFANLGSGRLGHHVPPRIEGDDGASAGPLLEGADGGGGLRVGEVGARMGLSAPEETASAR
jgi:hypothetical protein